MVTNILFFICIGCFAISYVFYLIEGEEIDYTDELAASEIMFAIGTILSIITMIIDRYN